MYSETIATASGSAAGAKGRKVAVGLNEIYKLVGGLGEAVRDIERSLEGLKKDIADSEQNSATSRANFHKRLDEVVLRTSTLESEVSIVKLKMDEMSGITDSVKELSQKAQGAGILGRVLLHLGIALITLAGWLVSAYQYFNRG